MMGSYRIALEIMCARCINYEVCGGSGCQPKNDLKELFELLEGVASEMKTTQEDDSDVT